MTDNLRPGSKQSSISSSSTESVFFNNSNCNENDSSEADSFITQVEKDHAEATVEGKPGKEQSDSSSYVLPVPPSYKDAVADGDDSNSKQFTMRLVYKNGNSNVVTTNISSKKLKFFNDMFTTIVDLHWGFNLLIFGLAFFITWIIFTFAYWSIAIIHEDHLHVNESEWESCIDNVHDFVSSFLFSVETQHTIGYGSRTITTACWYAIVVFMIQCCSGVLAGGLVSGLVFAKISRPAPRSRSVIFSQKAVVCMRNGVYCLVFRVGDMRKSHVITADIRALLVRNRITKEGESIPLCQYPIRLETEETRRTEAFLVWPITVIHKIDCHSPLWDLKPEQLQSDYMELIVIFEGVVEVSSKLMQVRTSYVSNEIIWGERFVPMISFKGKTGRYDVDYNNFNKTVEVPNPPKISAQQYDVQTASERSNGDTERSGLRLRKKESLETHHEEDEDVVSSIESVGQLENKVEKCRYKKKTRVKKFFLKPFKRQRIRPSPSY